MRPRGLPAVPWPSVPVLWLRRCSSAWPHELALEPELLDALVVPAFIGHCGLTQVTQEFTHMLFPGKWPSGRHSDPDALRMATPSQLSCTKLSTRKRHGLRAWVGARVLAVQAQLEVARP